MILIAIAITAFILIRRKRNRNNEDYVIRHSTVGMTQIPNGEIVIKEQVGRGNFGEVFKYLFYIILKSGI